jgi:membrane-associated protease RseP (regulator of RpoE activity)
MQQREQLKPFTFPLGNIPVRVHVSFLVVSAFLGMGGAATLASVVQWVLVVFLGVLLHEIGHALMGRSFGLAPEIDLEGMGGLTSWGRSGRRALGTARSVAVSFAGPLVGIAIGGAALLYLNAHELDLSRRANSLLTDVVWVNLGWGLLNLLPILPLDGGNILLAIAEKVTHGHGERPARLGSIGVAIVVALVALKFGQRFGALMVAYFAFFNYRALQASAAP